MAALYIAQVVRIRNDRSNIVFDFLSLNALEKFSTSKSDEYMYLLSNVNIKC